MSSSNQKSLTHIYAENIHTQLIYKTADLENNVIFINICTKIHNGTLPQNKMSSRVYQKVSAFALHR
jgi:hypothetical protein